MIVVETIKASASRQLTHFKFDITAKYFYSLHSIKGINSEWAENFYKEHLHIWNNFYKASPGKEGFEEYKKNFNPLIDTSDETGLNAEQKVISFACNGSPLSREKDDSLYQLIELAS